MFVLVELHFHNLYFDNKYNKYIKIDENGDEEDIAIIEEDFVRIKLVAIKQFLAIKEMVLLFLFDSPYYSKHTLQELSINKQHNPLIQNSNNITYSFSTAPNLGYQNYKSFSILHYLDNSPRFLLLVFCLDSNPIVSWEQPGMPLASVT